MNCCRIQSRMNKWRELSIRMVTVKPRAALPIRSFIILKIKDRRDSAWLSPVLIWPPLLCFACLLHLFPWSTHTTKRYAKLKERSEEHTSELQSRFDLVCRLLLE